MMQNATPLNPGGCRKCLDSRVRFPVPAAAELTSRQQTSRLISPELEIDFGDAVEIRWEDGCSCKI